MTDFRQHPEYAEGFRAAKDGRPPANPYRPGTRGNDAWAHGWADGAIEVANEQRRPGLLRRIWMAVTGQKAP